MIRDEQRKACIEAIAEAAAISVRLATTAFDAHHGIVRVCPIEATDEMVSAGVDHRDTSQGGLGKTFDCMSAVGDLTNSQEKTNDDI